MSEETWLAARLIPTSGINGAEEQERRATSALLAVMSAVREFGRTLTQPFGAPAGAVQTFIEVPFRLGERGAGRGSFIDSVLDAIDSFYVQVIQNLEPWLPAPPKLRPADGTVEPEPVAKALVSTAISSQDGPQFEPEGPPATVDEANAGTPPSAT